MHHSSLCCFKNVYALSGTWMAPLQIAMDGNTVVGRKEGLGGSSRERERCWVRDSGSLRQTGVSPDKIINCL